MAQLVAAVSVKMAAMSVPVCIIVNSGYEAETCPEIIL